MIKTVKRILSALITVTMVFSLCACHGTKGLKEFEIPESFDTSRQYEISSGLKTIQTLPRLRYTKRL